MNPLTLFKGKPYDTPQPEAAPASRFGVEELLIQASKLGALRIYQHTQGFTNLPAAMWDVKIVMDVRGAKIEVEKRDTTLNGALRLAIESALSFR